jgi:ethanolamine ammonia-lyase small subunit
MAEEAYKGQQSLKDVKARLNEAMKFTVDVPDVTTETARKTPGVENPKDLEGLKALIASTPYRVAVGSEGPRPRGLTYYQMRADHAACVDSLMYEVPKSALAKMGILDVGESAVEGDMEMYRRFPNEGRKFGEAARKVILEKCKKNPTVQFVLSNGLSGYAIERYAPDVLKGMIDGLKAAGIDVGTTVYVNRGRVGMLNDIGELVNATISVMLIGERPGLIVYDALSIYTGYMQRWEPLTTDTNRDNICQISKLGKDPLEAAAEGVALIKDYLKYKTSGNELADKKRQEES